MKIIRVKQRFLEKKFFEFDFYPKNSILNLRRFNKWVLFQ